MLDFLYNTLRLQYHNQDPDCKRKPTIYDVFFQLYREMKGPVVLKLSNAQIIHICKKAKLNASTYEPMTTSIVNKGNKTND